MKNFLQNTPIRVLIIILVIAIAATIALLQLSGIDRASGLWISVVLALLETALILGPKASIAMGGQVKFMRFFVIMLVIGAGLYAYVSLVMVPKAVEQTRAHSDPN